MALALAPYYQAAITFMDKDRNKSTVKLKYLSATPFDDIQTSLDTLVGLMVPLSNAKIIGYTLSSVFRDTDFLLTDIPEAADVERKAVIVMEASNGQISKLELPSIDNAFVIDGSNVVNDQNATVLAFLGALLTGNVGPDNGPVSNTGSDLILRVGAIRKIHRGSLEG